MGIDSRFIFVCPGSHSCHTARQASIATAYDGFTRSSIVPRKFRACASRGIVELHRPSEGRVVQLIDLSRLSTSREDESGPTPHGKGCR